MCRYKQMLKFRIFEVCPNSRGPRANMKCANPRIAIKVEDARVSLNNYR